jgi:kumamolisin
MNIPTHYRRLEGSERRPAIGARLLGPANPAETLSVILCVRRRADAPPLPDLGYWTATPPARRTFLSRQEFASRYGAAQDDVDHVTQFVNTHGLKVVEANVGRRTVVVSGTVNQVDHAFAVELGRYESPAGSYREVVR